MSVTAKSSTTSSSGGNGGNLDHHKKMRGPSRMICSPYFVGAALILLSIVSLKYWSLSWQNDELANRLESLQLQMKSDTFNLKNLKSSLTQKDQSLEECIKAKSQFQQTVEELNQKVKSKVEEYGSSQREKVKCDSDLSEARVDLRKCKEEKETLSNRVQSSVDDEAVKHKTEIERKESEMLELRKQVEALKGEVNSMKTKEAADEKIHVKGLEVDGAGDKAHKLGPGELAPVDPQAVHVRQKAEHGMTFHKDAAGHYMPLLPPGDPNQPRKQPRFSVVDMPKEDLFKKRKANSEQQDQSKIPAEKKDVVDKEKARDAAVDKEKVRDAGMEAEQKRDAPQEQLKAAKEGKHEEDIKVENPLKKAVEVGNPDAREADDDDRNAANENEEDQDPNGDIEDRGDREMEHAVDQKVKPDEDEDAFNQEPQQQQQMPHP